MDYQEFVKSFPYMVTYSFAVLYLTNQYLYCSNYSLDILLEGRASMTHPPQPLALDPHPILVVRDHWHFIDGIRSVLDYEVMGRLFKYTWKS